MDNIDLKSRLGEQKEWSLELGAGYGLTGPDSHTLHSQIQIFTVCFINNTELNATQEK